MPPCDGTPLASLAASLGAPDFSDCTIRLWCDPGSSLLAPPDASLGPIKPPPATRGGFPVREVPVCTLVLSAKSEYFRILFTGSFSESSRRDKVDIHVPEDGEEAFLDLLYFLYNGALPGATQGNIQRALKLLAISDLLDTKDCFTECIALLKASLGNPKLSSVGGLSEAILFLHLPPLLQTRPCLTAAVDAAKRCIIRGHSPLFRAPYGPNLYSIPEYVLTLMLESDDLVVDHEDDVLEASKAWVLWNYAESAAEALCRIVLPRIRHLSLSPKALLSLAIWEKQFFFGVEDAQESNWASTRCTPSLSPSNVRLTAGSLLKRASQTDPKQAGWPMARDDEDNPLEEEEVSESTGTYPGAQAAAEAHEASLCALLALSERCFVEYGAVPGGASLAGFMTGRSWRGPRTSCLPPCGRIYLDIPLHFCKAWQPLDDDLASSALTLVSGRWLELRAQYHSDPGTLGLWVTWHKDVVGPTPNRDSWVAKCKFCVMTEASQPAYQTLHITQAKFEEEVSCWGIEAALNMASILEDSSFFFPQGALRVRADIWLVT